MLPSVRKDKFLSLDILTHQNPQFSFSVSAISLNFLN